MPFYDIMSARHKTEVVSKVLKNGYVNENITDPIKEDDCRA